MSYRDRSVSLHGDHQLSGLDQGGFCGADLELELLDGFLDHQRGDNLPTTVELNLDRGQRRTCRGQNFSAGPTSSGALLLLV